MRQTVISLLALTLLAGTLMAPATAEPQSFTGLYRDGVYAYREGHYAEALHHLREARRLSPNNANLRYYLAVVLDKLDRGQEALPHYRYVISQGDDANVVNYSRYRVAKLARDGDDGMTVSERAVDKAIAGSEAVSAVAVPLKPHHNALMVEALLNNRTGGTFIVDTGATYTSISHKLYEELGDSARQIGTVRITTANGRIEVPKILIDEVTINGLTAYDVEATVIDVHNHSSFSGLLGLSFLRKFRLTIDPTQGELVFQAI